MKWPMEVRMNSKRFKRNVDSYLNAAGFNVRSALNFSVDTIGKYGNYNMDKISDCYQYSSDQLSQLTQLKEGSEPLKAYLINQAEMRNALMYKLGHDVNDLKTISEDVADEYKELAQNNIKRVRKSGMNSSRTSRRDRFVKV